MTRDDIIRVMREVLGPESEGLSVNEELLEEVLPFLQAVAAAAKAEEREACLEIADHCADADMHASMVANAIRARGQA